MKEGKIVAAAHQAAVPTAKTINQKRTGYLPVCRESNCYHTTNADHEHVAHLRVVDLVWSHTPDSEHTIRIGMWTISVQDGMANTYTAFGKRVAAPTADP